MASVQSAIAFASAGPRVRGLTRAAPLRNSRAIRPHLLPGRIAPRCPEPPAAPASDARAHVPRFRSCTVCRDVWPGGRHGCEAEARSLAHGPAAAPADGDGAGWARIRPPRPAARGGRAVSTTGGSRAGASIRTPRALTGGAARGRALGMVRGAGGSTAARHVRPRKRRQTSARSDWAATGACPCNQRAISRGGNGRAYR